MKGRSSRLQNSEQNDDWVNGSWTVDCVCGVNFDDGEEMVDCDECGVWVHTRCSGYDKGDKMFMCDKCKSKGNRSYDNNETEVAQLLVELPTKTMRMESSLVSSGGAGRRSYRLWTDIPMEERVHVQGIPGGEPELFSGLSKVFSPQLWKCSGYAPKKFNFRYREFPWWDEDEKAEGDGKENDENLDDKGAGVLFSLAKESVVVGTKAGDEEKTSSKKALSKEVKKVSSEDAVGKQFQSGKKERNLLCRSVMQSGKKRKEDFGATKDHDGKRKAMAVDKDGDMGRRVLHSSSTEFASSSDAKQPELFEDGDVKVLKVDTHCVGSGKVKEISPRDNARDLAANRMVDKVKDRDALAKGLADNQDLTTVGSPIGLLSVLEGGKKATDKMGNCREDFTNNSGKSPDHEGPARTMSEGKHSKVIQGFHSDRVASSADPGIGVKTGFNDKSVAVLNGQSSPTDAKHTGISSDHVSKNFKTNDVSASSVQSPDQKPLGVHRKLEVVSDCQRDAVSVSISNSQHRKQDIDGSDGAVAVDKSVSESIKCLENSSVLPTLHKALTSVAKSSSSSSTNMISRSSTSDISKAAETQNPSPITSEQVTSKFTASKKDSSNDVTGGEEVHHASRRITKECLNSSENSAVKVKYSSKISHTYVSKRSISASKEYAHPSSKASSSHNTAVTSGSSDSAGSLQNQTDTNVDNIKTSASGLIQQVERNNQSDSQPSSKLNHTLTHIPISSNTPAALSDEELALLLHQELNSSPRVPRVPRVRQAGNLPHVASSTPTSMLIKRSSSAGAKDHNTMSRRRNKDMKDTSRSSREIDDEVKRTERLIPPSSDKRRQGTEALTRRDDKCSSAAVHTIKRNVPSSCNTGNSGPSSSPEANDHNSPAVHSSPRNPDENSGTVQVPLYLTLPGLISEIMSKGERMSYEELCNAVLPHWPNLRKHNGERYAYSSPSQAVLDCLRNRQEWAQLVDRGPKTSSNRKKRMVDDEESDDDDEYVKGRSVKKVEDKIRESQREDFPKGKRKARKRRRLALQGRGVRDVRRRQKTDMLSDDDVGGLPDSSEESMFNEYDGGSEVRPVGSEASASSD